METRTAPRAIRETEQRYQRAHTVWACANVLWWLAFLLMALSVALPYAAFRYTLALVCLAGLSMGRPGQRARRYGAAARTLSSAILRYAVSPDRPESLLQEADRRARELLRVERIRTAPAWVRDQRRRYWLKILEWFGTAVLAVTLSGAALLLGLRWPRPRQLGFVLAAFLICMVGALYGTRNLWAARSILGEAMERYEFESAATGSELDEAGQRASEAASGTSGRGEPAL